MPQNIPSTQQYVLQVVSLCATKNYQWREKMRPNDVAMAGRKASEPLSPFDQALELIVELRDFIDTIHDDIHFLRDRDTSRELRTKAKAFLEANP